MMSDVTIFFSSNKTFYNKNWWFLHITTLREVGWRGRVGEEQ